MEEWAVEEWVVEEWAVGAEDAWVDLAPADRVEIAPAQNAEHKFLINVEPLATNRCVPNAGRQ